jgi:hypothetical protein
MVRDAYFSFARFLHVIEIKPVFASRSPMRQIKALLLVPKLRLGNAVLEAPASSPSLHGKQELPKPGSQSGDWEPANTAWQHRLWIGHIQAFTIMLGLGVYPAAWGHIGEFDFDAGE